MIWGIHYFIIKLKTKIDVIPRSCFNISKVYIAHNNAVRLFSNKQKNDVSMIQQ